MHRSDDTAPNPPKEGISFEQCVWMELTLTPPRAYSESALWSIILSLLRSVRLSEQAPSRKAVQLGGVFNFNEQSYELPPSPFRRLAALFANHGTYTVDFGIKAGKLSLELTNLTSPVKDRGMVVPLPVDRTIETTVTSAVIREQMAETTGTLNVTAKLHTGSTGVAASGKRSTKGGDTIQRSEKRSLCEVTIHSTGPLDAPVWRFQVHTTDNNKSILFGKHVEPCVAKLVIQQPGKPYRVVGTFRSHPDDLRITRVSDDSLKRLSDRKRAAVQARVLKHLRAKMPDVSTKKSVGG